MTARSASREHESKTTAAASRQRLDKWLWFARVAKTRTLAATLVTEGKVRVNKQRVSKPSHELRSGDAVTIALRQRVQVLRVVGFAERRGSAESAAGLYEDLTAPIEATDAHGRMARTRNGPAVTDDAQRLPGAGRPTKRERRQIDRFKMKSV